MSEATTRYLEGVREDCASVLGPGIPVLSVQQEELDDGVRLLVRYDIGGKVQATVATGETVVAAHAALRMQLVSDRLTIGFTGLVSRR